MTFLNFEKRLKFYLKNIHLNKKYEDSIQNYINESSEENKFLIFETAKNLEVFSNPLKKELQKVCAYYIQEAEKENLLKPIEEGKASTIFGQKWTEIVTKGWNSLEEYEKNNIKETFANLIIDNIINTSDSKDIENIIQTVYHSLEKGEFINFTKSTELLQNFADGRMLNIKMNNWQPTLYQINTKGKEAKPTSQPHDLFFEMKVNFPSGSLLVSDMICIENIQEKRNISKSLNVNYSWDRIFKTITSLNQDFIDFSSKSDGPNLVQGENPNIIFGGDENEEFKKIASICYDYWGIQVVDEKNLERFLDHPENQEELTKKWLEESDYNQKIQVEPGQWYVYWDEDLKTLNKSLKEANIKAPENTTFVLSKNKLNLSDKNKFHY